jgi:endonuclease/exonuclease/phosphatase family metal-dependent hydrolase
MLVRKTLLPTFTFHDFPTNMARKLLVANLNLEMGQSFQVGTVHLESLGNPDLRAQQLEISNRVLKAGSSAILCGDFNFCSYRNYSKRLQQLENTHLPTRLPGYVDVWEEIYPASVDRDRQLPSTEDIRTGAASSQADTIVDAGFTFDSETNPMLQNYEQMRYDRIMLRSRRWQAVDIQILGKDPIAFDSKHGIPIAVPSDHYGLVTTLQLVDDTGRRTPDTEEVQTTDPFQTPPPSKKHDLL